MVESISGWAFTRAVKDVNERSGRIPRWAYTRLGLITTLKDI